jgi:hypothetical protein
MNRTILVYLFIAGTFAVLAVGCLVRPRFRGSPVRIELGLAALVSAKRRYDAPPVPLNR